MGDIILAKEKVKSLTQQIEKDLYKLKYGNEDNVKLTNNLYNKLKVICSKHSCDPLTFPLKKVAGEVHLNEDNDDLYKVLHILAEDFSIVLKG